MKFELSDKVFYPGHGVAVIEEIIERVIAGSKAKFFKLNFIYKDVIVLIPIRKDATNLGIRHLSTKQKIERVFDELYKAPIKKVNPIEYSPSSWNKRNKDYQLKIQGGELLDIAKIYRDLMYTSKDKELSFGEKKILETTKELLVEEILLVSGESRDVVTQKLYTPFLQLDIGDFARSTSTLSTIL